ncbi:MAG: TRAP transporter large permease [Candidatus Sumerlaeia bacterium]
MEELLTGPSLGIIGIVVMLASLFLLRIPAGFAMAIVGFFGIALQRSSFQAAFFSTTSDFWISFQKPGLTVIPMFILLGEFIFYAGYSDRLFHASDRWFGQWRGGLAVSSIFASAGFSAICGSNTATAATMSAVAIPSMKKYHYHPTLSTGSVAAGATLGVMVPPSIVLVVYGLQSGQSISQLFFGALIPAAILTILMGATVMLICLRHPTWGPPAEKVSWAERWRALPQVIDIIILFAAIMLALSVGMVTPTEAGAVSCFLGLILCLVRRKLSRKGFLRAIYDTLRISCMVFMIVVGATIFGHFITSTRLPFMVADWVGGLNWPGWLVLVMIMLCYVAGGCLMDALAFLLVSLPIFIPLVENMSTETLWFGQSYGLVWFGVFICVVTTLGAITPPIGICCYVIGGMFRDIRLEQVFRGALYFIPAYIVLIILLMLFPDWLVMSLAGLVR